MIPAVKPSATFAALCAWLLLFVLQASPTRVAVSDEHLALALNLARGGGPALSADDFAAVDATLATYAQPPVSTTVALPELVGRDGQQDVPHFWLYALASVPMVWGTQVAGIDPLWAFLGLNVLLLTGLAAVIALTGGASWTALLLLSPIVWWIDKPSADVLIFVGLGAGLLLWPSRPSLALVLLALAGGQNPGFVLTTGLFAVWGSIERPSRLLCPRWRTALVLATLITVIGPAYYLWRLGLPSPLTAYAPTHFPGVLDLVFPITDVNMGLAMRFPPFVVAVVSAVYLLARHELLRLREPFLATTALAALALLYVVSQPLDQNHGGSPDLSRYALWLMPLAAPLLAQAATSARAATRRLGLVFCVAAALWTFADFRPARAERYLEPTPLADWLWTRHPMWNNPRAESFAERVSHRRPPVVPAATAACEKVLLFEGEWPVHCLPLGQPPEGCRQAGRFCYANRTATGAGYLFVDAGATTGVAITKGERTWARETPAVATLRTLVAGMTAGEPEVPTVSVRAVWNVGWAQPWTGPDGAVLYARQTRADARIGVRARVPMTARVIDLGRQVDVATVAIAGGTDEPEVVPLPEGATDVAVVFSRR
jgi:hypothetical protein